MALEEKLAAIRETARTRQPPEVQTIMHQTTGDLRASGIMDRVARVGAPAPDFTLPNVAGQPVSLTALRARGPVVLSFYRGRW
ncbi:MAG: redoxin domain-containing protein [Candidatus Rokuibacteriota bacterium]